MNTITNHANKVHAGITATVTGTLQKVKEKLAEKDGNFFVEHGLAIVIAVVIAAILIVAIVALFKNKIIPQTNNKVDDFFNMAYISSLVSRFRKQ